MERQTTRKPNNIELREEVEPVGIPRYGCWQELPGGHVNILCDMNLVPKSRLLRHEVAC